MTGLLRRSLLARRTVIALAHLPALGVLVAALLLFAHANDTDLASATVLMSPVLVFVSVRNHRRHERELRESGAPEDARVWEVRQLELTDSPAAVIFTAHEALPALPRVVSGSVRRTRGGSVVGRTARRGAFGEVIKISVADGPNGGSVAWLTSRQRFFIGLIDGGRNAFNVAWMEAALTGAPTSVLRPASRAFEEKRRAG